MVKQLVQKVTEINSIEVCLTRTKELPQKFLQNLAFLPKTMAKFSTFHHKIG